MLNQPLGSNFEAEKSREITAALGCRRTTRIVGTEIPCEIFSDARLGPPSNRLAATEAVGHAQSDRPRAIHSDRFVPLAVVREEFGARVG